MAFMHLNHPHFTALSQRDFLLTTLVLVYLVTFFVFFLLLLTGS